MLPSLALPWAASLIYLATYFGGAVLAMSLFAWVVGALTSRPKDLPRVLTVAGLASLCTGIWWVALSAWG